MCCETTKPMHHSYWACALEPALCNTRSHGHEKPVGHKQQGSPHSPQLQRSPCRSEDPAQPKVNKENYKVKSSTIKKKKKGGGKVKIETHICLQTLFSGPHSFMYKGHHWTTSESMPPPPQIPQAQRLKCLWSSPPEFHSPFLCLNKGSTH